MVTTIDIDIGGTFTEAVANRGGDIRWGKVLTTPYNISRGVLQAIVESARKFDLEARDLLAETDIVRYSTTIALNSLIQRKGVKLGLITTRGLEHLVLIGRSRQWGDGLPRHLQRKTGAAVNPEPLIEESMIIGVNERTDSLGNRIIQPPREEIIEALRKLVQNGARGIVVMFLWSFLNPANELYVKEVIEEELPEIYLGNVPILLSSQAQPKWLEYPRLMVTILNAYLHLPMSEQLNTLGDEVRELGYRRPLMLVHNSGGMAKLARSKLTDTYNAGPVAGMVGTAHIAKLYGIRNVITAEMGGTTFNIGVITDGEPKSYEFDPVIDRWTVNLTMVENRSIGAGGGSIAWFNEALGNRLEVGPVSAGSNPGPVCYNLGGREPTVTDADLVLGYLNEKYFLGGRMRLDKEKAKRIVKEKVADRLGVTVEEAAWAIKCIIDEHMSVEISTDVALKGFDPREFVLFSFGGAGPVHAVGINLPLKAERILAFPFGAVFDAIGSSFLNVKHIYERTVGITAFNPSVDLAVSVSSYASKFNDAVEEMRGMALRDIRSEGLKQDNIVYSLELDMRYETQLMVTKIQSLVWRIEGRTDAQKIINGFKSEFLRICGIEFPDAVVRIENIRLLAEAPIALKPAFPKLSMEPADPSHALKGKREVYWGDGGFLDTRIYDFHKLRPGNIVEGPTVLEAADTTFVIPENFHVRIDEYGNSEIKAS